MKAILPTVVVAFAATLIACDASQPTASQPGAVTAPGMPPAPTAGPASGTTGEVLETMTSGGYTYVRIKSASGEMWAAAPQTTVAVGEQVTVPGGMAMKDFESKTLGRTFDVVYFVAGLKKGGAAAPSAPTAPAAPAAQMPPGHAGAPAPGSQMPPGHAGAPAAAPTVDVGNIAKAAGGHRVAEIFAQSAALSGKQVTVRGKVIKFNANIMNKNWIHLQDGTGAAGTNDLTITTSATAEKGQTVLIRGRLATDKDFGFGYKYAVMIEEATVTVE